jgi:hypothetical protein
MMKRSGIALCSLGFLLAAACGDKNDDGGMMMIDPNLRTFSVEVRGSDGAALENATILLDLAGKTEAEKTSAGGRAAFTIDKTGGVGNIHIFHQGHRFTSLYAIDVVAEDQLIVGVDRAADAAAPMIAIARATGIVNGWDLLAPNTPDRARIAQVMSIGEVEELEQGPRPGTVTPGNADGTEWNLVVNGDSPFPQWTDYGLELDARTQTLAVFAGTFTVAAEPVLEYSHVGVRTGMKAVANEEIKDQDIAITHALDQRFEVIASDVPRLSSRKARFGLELAGTGDVVPLGLVDLESGIARVYAPSLSGVLEGATYVANVEASGGSSMVIARMRGAMSSFTFAPLLAAVGEPTAAGRTLAATPASGATVHVYTLRDETRGLTLWSAFVRGDETRSIDLPAAPEGFADPLRGRLTLSVTAYELSEEPSAMNEAALENEARSIARTHASVDL